MVSVLAAGGLILLLLNAPSTNLTLGRRTRVARETVPPSGGTVVVNAPGNEIDGLTIHVPEGAYSDSTGFTVSTRPIENHKLGPDFNPASPLITIDNGEAFAAEPMMVDIPISIADDEFAMAFYYDARTGQLEGIPIVALAPDKVTLVTSHFSDMVVSRISLSELVNVSVDTGFLPGVDDWQFTNYGSAIAPGGHCAGQSLTAMWYYFEKRLGAGERPLYGRYDNNNYGYGTIDFQEDDSWGYRWASVAQYTQWDTDHGVSVLRALGSTSDYLTWYAFAYSMKLTGEPQYVSIGRYVTVDDQQRRRGHALVAYRIENGNLWVADPNYPGMSDRIIGFENGGFQPYASGENARDIAANGVRVYTEIHYLAKSALIDWTLMGTQYEQMVDGEVGDDLFPRYILSYLAEVNPTTGEAVWKDLPDTLELTEEDTAKAGEQNRGGLVIGVGMAAGQSFLLRAYDGTTLQVTQPSDTNSKAVIRLPLSPGTTDLGFEIQALVHGANQYTDFQRVRLIYGVEDLSGTWEGTWRIESADKVRQFVVEAVAKILMSFGVDEAKAWEAANAGVETDPNLYDERPLRMVFEQIDADTFDRYRVRAYLPGADAEVYETEATFREGVVALTIRSADNSAFKFRGTLSGHDAVTGDFTVTAWYVIKDAITGSWEMTRLE